MGESEQILVVIKGKYDVQWNKPSIRGSDLLGDFFNGLRLGLAGGILCRFPLLTCPWPSSWAALVRFMWSGSNPVIQTLASDRSAEAAIFLCKGS